MKYFEKEDSLKDKDLHSRFDFVKWLALSLMVCPIRLMSEIFYKVLFLGVEICNYLRTCIFINLGFLGVNFIISFLVTKRIYLKNTFIPIPSLIVSLVLLTVAYFLITHFELFIELGESDDSTFTEVVKEEKKEESVVEEVVNSTDIDLDSCMDTINELVNEMDTSKISKDKLEDIKADSVANLKESMENYPLDVKVGDLYVSESERQEEITDRVLNQPEDVNSLIEALIGQAGNDIPVSKPKEETSIEDIAKIIGSETKTSSLMHEGVAKMVDAESENEPMTVMEFTEGYFDEDDFDDDDFEELEY